jgi:type VI secretion system protein ImpL
MKISRSTWIAISLFILWLVLTWRLSKAIAPHMPMLAYLWIGFWLIGIAGLVGYLLLRPKQSGEKAQGSSAAEIDFNFAEATKHIQSAGVKKLNTLPSVFILGDSATAKTSIIAKSGLEPDLLAGHAYQDYIVAPTRVLNLWYARQTLFIDPAGAVIADPGARKKLFSKLAPVGFKSILGGKQPPPRSVVFTVDCDIFMQQGSAEALAAKARQFQTILTELSQELGSNFPVYVLFTKADRLPYFREYVSNFTEAEASEIFGKTLLLHTPTARGVYAEQETKRLTDAFQDLYYSLCDRRPAYLLREHNATQLPDIYEFPREFAKLRPLLVQFLVDLCRPSQLGVSPFLRGFYFTGVRPVSVADVAPATPLGPVLEEQGFDSGATRIFSGGGRGGPRMQAEVLQSGSRKVPQWVFLTHLFSDLILVDQPAMVATGSSVKVNFWRRALLASVAVLSLFLSIWWIVSYTNNRALVHDAVEAARAVPTFGLPSAQLAPLDSLQRLAKVRDTLAVLRGYEKNGAPFGLSGGLYAGDNIRQPLRTTYYALFRKLLLSPTQLTLVGLCLKPEDSESKGYRYIYDALKAYLITTNHYEKSTPEFLTPVLLEHWQNGQQVDMQRQDLARQDFEFYTEELPEGNPYPKFANPDSEAVETARNYLKRFSQTERIYTSMLQAAGDGLKPIVFNQDFPESRGLIVNSYRVDPAFTKKGYAAFQKLLQDPDRYFQGEEWVLGPTVFASYDKQKLVQEVTQRFRNDFIKTWREYLHATSFVGYASVPDIATKLGKLTTNQSPLLEVVCVASENTSVDAKEITEIFQPVQAVTPAPCLTRPHSQANASYMQSLLHVQSAVQQIRSLDSPDAVSQISTANSAESQGEESARQLSTGFNRDSGAPRVDEKTTAILLDPLRRIPDFLGHAAEGVAKAPLNGAAGGLCQQISPLLAKYPFNPRSTTDATLQEVNQFLKPGDGVFWKLYDQTFNKILTRSGSEFTVNSQSNLKVNPAFLAFMNRLLHMSESFYKSGAQEPNLTFSMQPVAAPDVDHITLTIDGTTLSQDMRSAAKQTFTWPGSTQEAHLKVRFTGGSEFGFVDKTGVWAIWHFLDTAEKWQSYGSQYQVEWTEKTTAQVVTINGHPATVRFLLDPQGSQVFRPQGFSGAPCSSIAVK